ncbi:carboxylesterase patB [Trichoderma asperellum]|uniref:Carboxylic ester hydrolase n=1 Tax=Trichoderma asperellum TaxID=101201 RepID=A0A6V8QK67_TRIAP|nr:carboxylesterase patB [Trichoderma asperellum]
MRRLVFGSFVLSAALGANAAPVTGTDSSCLPVVDLGYELHQALSYNTTTQAYIFQNIRYAQPPVGYLRFRAPMHPKTNRTPVQTAPNCDSALKASHFGRAWEESIKDGKPLSVDWNSGAQEDCLFLDVHVTKKAFEKARSKSTSCGGDGAPVLVWIHGGGFALGSKTGTPTPGYDPVGLFEHAAANSDQGLVFVALNYRLGALGFMAGLLDHKFALQWVQDNIHLFGGSKERVTLMGESAGGGSVLLHMTANHGQGSGLFSQAIPQSPATIPTMQVVKDGYSQFLSYLNVASLEEARAADTRAVIAANAAQIGAAPTTTYIFGPVIDGEYITDSPAKLIKDGNFDKSVEVLAGHNMFEGAFFFDPNVTTNDEFSTWISRSFAGLTNRDVTHLATSLYPPQFDGSLGYVDMDTRQMKLWSEAVIDCNYFWIGQGVRDKGYAYEFGISPGFHIQDLKYTFNDPTSPAPWPKAQDALQEAIVTFVQGGVPKFTNHETFPHLGSHGTIVNITSQGAVETTRNVNATRCDWWANLSQ